VVHVGPGDVAVVVDAAQEGLAARTGSLMLVMKLPPIRQMDPWTMVKPPKLPT
jgi:hypothetical protein